MSVSDTLTKMYDLVSGSNDPVLLKTVMEVQQELIRIQEENRELRNEVHELKNVNIVESELIFRNGVYLKGKGVFCSACWDKNKELVRVRKHPGYNESGEDILFFCDVCDAYRYSDLDIEELSSNKPS